jgi:hypothetical protein
MSLKGIAPGRLGTLEKVTLPTRSPLPPHDESRFVNAERSDQRV